MNTPTPRRLVAVVLIALALTGCSSSDDDGREPGARPDPPLTLTIVSSDWNGWDPDHRATPETTTLPVEVGAEVTLDGMGEQVTFEVVEVSDDEVEVSSDRQLAPMGETGGSNLNDLVDGFTVVSGEETTVDTPTLDAGYSYTWSLAAANDG